MCNHGMCANIGFDVFIVAEIQLCSTYEDVSSEAVIAIWTGVTYVAHNKWRVVNAFHYTYLYFV